MLSKLDVHRSILVVPQNLSCNLVPRSLSFSKIKSFGDVITQSHNFRGTVFLLTVACLTFVYEHPQHTSIPWKAIFSSLPLWAIVVAHFTQGWGLYTMLSELPLFYTQRLNLDLKEVCCFEYPFRNFGIWVNFFVCLFFYGSEIRKWNHGRDKGDSPSCKRCLALLVTSVSLTLPPKTKTFFTFIPVANP